MVSPCEHAKTVFLQALDLPEADRAAFVRVQCGGDDSLRREVEDLLQHHAKVDEAFLAAAPISSPQQERAAEGASITLDYSIERPGAMIGPYKLLEQIGEGGMGTVWMAQQTDPVKRLVALKLIKPGMDSKQIIARFEAERQALALMDHPNIAKVLGHPRPDPPPSRKRKKATRREKVPSPLVGDGLGGGGARTSSWISSKASPSRSTATTIASRPGSGWSCSFPSARRCSTHIRKASFTVISSPRTYSWLFTTADRCRR
jgi:hypothetical protein